MKTENNKAIIEKDEEKRTDVEINDIRSRLTKNLIKQNPYILMNIQTKKIEKKKVKLCRQMKRKYVELY